MKKLILILCMLLLLCSCADAATKIGLDRLNWSQSLPVGANVTLNEGYLVDAKLGGSSPEVTVGAYKWCDFVTDGVNDEVQILQALDTGKNVHLVGDLYINSNLTIDGRVNIYGDGPGRSAIIEKGVASIVFSDIIQTRFSNIEVKRDLGGSSKNGTVGINVERAAPFWSVYSIFSNLYVHGSDTDLVLGQSLPRNVVGLFSIIDCTFGPNPSDLVNPANRDNVSIDVRYGIEPKFTRCEIDGFNHTGLLIGPGKTNNVWIEDCYINGQDIGKYGIYIQNGDAHLISRIGSESCAEANIYISGGNCIRIDNSFFGGGGDTEKTGQCLVIKSDFTDIYDVTISNCRSAYATGSGGLHAQDPMIEITDGIGGEIHGIAFRNCEMWDNGYGAVNVTNAMEISIQGCNIRDFHEVYRTTAVSGAINFIGECSRGSVQNNIIGMSNQGITIQDTSWGIMVTGNNIYGTNLGGDAINITTTRPWTITNSTNYWMTWA